MSKRKNEILDVSLALFLQKGFDETSITDILEHLGIARGTLYYHFESKEAIMDAVIERLGEDAFSSANAIAQDSNQSALDKLYVLFREMRLHDQHCSDQILDYLHRPQNALLHEKSNQMIIKRIAPVLSKIIEQGIKEKVFKTPFPTETAEMILCLGSTFLDASTDFSPSQTQQRLDAFWENVERMLGAKKGSFCDFNDVRKLEV